MVKHYIFQKKYCIITKLHILLFDYTYFLPRDTIWIFQENMKVSKRSNICCKPF